MIATDVAGNVWEWVHDGYQSTLGTTPVTDPVATPLASPHRVVRGGSWASGPGKLRAAARLKKLPTYKYGSLGLRCARTMP